MKKVAFAIMLCAGTPAFGGEETIVDMGSFTLRDGQGTYIKNAKGEVQGFTTLELCVAAGIAQVPMGTAPEVNFRCDQVARVKRKMNCVGVPKPPLATFTVLDGAAVIYKGPYCAKGETCDKPPADNPDFVYTDAGGLKLNEDGTTDVYTLVPKDNWPTCWLWDWVRVNETPPPAADMTGADIVPVAPDAFKGETEEPCMGDKCLEEPQS